MTQNSQDRTVRIVANHHDQIVTFAPTNYQDAGRGVIQMDFPDVPPGTTVRDKAEHAAAIELKAVPGQNRWRRRQQAV